MDIVTTKPVWMIAAFIFVIIVLLIIDLCFFNKKDHEISIKESLYLSCFYISMALLFGFWIWYELGAQRYIEYLTGYLIEKSLSLDNIFVISLIFSSLNIPHKYQHRVLFFGILGVVILRALMIYLGTQLVIHFSFVIYLFSVFLIYIGIKMFSVKEEVADISDNFFLRFMRRHFKITPKLHGNKFFVKYKGESDKRKYLYITPLFVALIMIEFTDLIFAVDSVPAIFIITQDPYVVYTSNIFAVLGLRSLYFALAVLIGRFYYLKFSLAIILIFIGLKTFIADFLDIEKFPAYISLIVTFSLLLVGGLLSLYRNPELKK